MSDAESPHAINDRAWRHLSRMHQYLEGQLGRGLAAHGLSHPDYLVLTALDEDRDGRRRLVELARDLGWEKSRTSHHVARMCARGLVAKSTCPTDRRGTFVVLTDEGRRARALAAPDYLADVTRLFLDAVTPVQLTALDTIATTVLTRADGEVGDDSPARPSLR